MNQQKTAVAPGFSAFTLHILAMALMLCDHLWATLVPGNQWLTVIGRIAYPIFAFLIVEGFFHTSNLKKYLLRLLIFAVISEIPFNLMYASSLLYPFHQNVLWTLILGLLCIRTLERIREKCQPWAAAPLSALCAAGFLLAAAITFVDYGAWGLLTVLIFYFFRGRSWWQLLGQAAGLVWINWELISGLVIPVTVFGLSFELPQQGAAILALIPIWLYRGRQGPHSKWLRYGFYIFYPLHMLILGLLSR